nr:beta-1,3-galactosyl-O-glycosyl-glycoprotein beta-1,6-N-acetylglucosaminyltransferase 4-like [Nerophis lumbriciformis]
MQAKFDFQVSLRSDGGVPARSQPGSKILLGTRVAAVFVTPKMQEPGGQGEGVFGSLAHSRWFLGSLQVYLVPWLTPGVRREDDVVHTAHCCVCTQYNVSCSAVYDLDPVELESSLVIRRKKDTKDPDETLRNLTADYSHFLQVRGYEDVCATEKERHFHLAYSLVVHKYAWMVERLIRALYSPSNVFCIHYDQKSPAVFRSAMEGIARCLPNVFIASKREYVIYAGFTRLKADINCLSDLLEVDVPWKYVINLCGQDFPLKTNIELVSELAGLNGANMLETCRPSKSKKQRFSLHYEQKDRMSPKRTNLTKSAPPHGIEMFTGSAYFVLSRGFVVYMNASVVVKDFLAWSEDTYSPDEHFWATLVRIPGAPGGVPRSNPDITGLLSKTRMVKWKYQEENLYPACTGKHARSICIPPAHLVYLFCFYCKGHTHPG